MGASLAQRKKLRREVVMKLKNRYSLWRFRGNLFESRAMRRLKKSGKGNTFRFGDIFVGASVLILLNFDMFPEGIPHAEWIQMLVALVVLFIGLFFNFRRLAPRTCWSRASWATGSWALMMTVVPILLYWLGEFDDITLVYQLVATSSILWVICIACILRLRYIRRRSLAEIAAMRLREKRRRRLENL